MAELFLLGITLATFLMALSKRMTALIRNFFYQSLLLFLVTALLAYHEKSVSLSIIALLILIIKVIVIPFVLKLIMQKLNVKEDLGLFLNVQLSLVVAFCFSWLAWYFTTKFITPASSIGFAIPTVALFMTLIGLFLMISRMTALAQVVGLLVMENGLFLFASAISAGMPFLIEIAIFFDVLMSVLIMAFFVHKINKLFTHIDVHKLSRLRG